MSDYRETMRTVAAATAPSDAAIGRVRRRLDAQVQPTTVILAHLGEPSPFEVERLRRRLRGPRLHRRPAWVWPVAGGLALAAAATIATLATLATDARTAVVPPTDVTLAASDTATIRPSPLIALTYSGDGRLTGADPDWRVEWENGTVDVSVTPNAGADVVVQTRDATVHVVGTAFTVDRGPLGTAVQVERGQVEVTCTLGGEHTLTTGDAVTCWPASPAGLLGRALAQADRGDAAAHRLATLDAGLDLADAADPARGELLAHRIAPLLEEGRSDEALDDAEAYLASGGDRAEELRGVAAHLALALHGCERALPHLSALDAPTAEQRAHQERCTR